MNIAVKAANQALNVVVLIAVMAMLALGGYVMWDSSQVFAQASETNYAPYKPSGTADLSFQDLQNMNPEVIGWLNVYGTHIDYPITQGKDDMKYINTDAMGDYSLSGAIFLDASNNPGFTDISSIVYGHHMDADTMFGELTDFADAGYFASHQYGSLYADGQTLGLQFFAFVHADAYDETVYNTKVGSESEVEYVNGLKALATQVRSDVSIKPGDRLILLSTCSSSTTNGRDILVGEISATAQPDTFAKSTGGNVAALATVDSIVNGRTLPGISAAVLCAVIVGTAIYLVTKRRHAKAEGGER